MLIEPHFHDGSYPDERSLSDRKYTYGSAIPVASRGFKLNTSHVLISRSQARPPMRQFIYSSTHYFNGKGFHSKFSPLTYFKRFVKLPLATRRRRPNGGTCLITAHMPPLYINTFDMKKQVGKKCRKAERRLSFDVLNIILVQKCKNVR